MNQLSVKDKLLKLYSSGIVHQVELAEQLGTSRQYISQLMKQLNLPVIKKQRAVVVCVDCGKVISGAKGVNNSRCRACFWKYKRHNQNIEHISLVCKWCNIPFKLLRSDYENRITRFTRKVPFFFCSKQCYGSFLGSNFGFNSNIEPIVFTKEKV